MKSVHLVIPDLFLPEDIAAEVCADLRLPALERLLARGASTGSDHSTGSGRTGEGGCLENHLCKLFGVKYEADAPIAPISATFDGLAAGCWLRVDPVHLHLQRDRMLLSAVLPTGEEAAALCASLNEYFTGQGMEFFAPHPQRWYVRLDALPRIRTTPLSQVIGGNVRGALPGGEDAARWHGVCNEIQMLLHSHPVNEAREARGELPVNSVWLWGGGCDTLLIKPLAIRLGEQTTLAKSLVTAEPADCGNSRQAAPAVQKEDAMACRGGGCGVNATLQNKFDSVSSDDVLPEMFAASAGVPFSEWAEQWREVQGRQLLVWTGLRGAVQRGDLAAWRAALQDFEAGYAQPLWQALRAGKIERLQIDVLGGVNVRQVRLSRADTWAFWRRAKPLARYSLV